MVHYNAKFNAANKLYRTQEDKKDVKVLESLIDDDASIKQEAYTSSTHDDTANNVKEVKRWEAGISLSLKVPVQGDSKKEALDESIEQISLYAPIVLNNHIIVFTAVTINRQTNVKESIEKYKHYRQFFIVDGKV